VSELHRAVGRAGRFLDSVYALGLGIDAGDFVIPPHEAHGRLPAGGPRSGVIAVEGESELQLGLYLDPRDQRDSGTIIEETSHLLCLAWHAARELPVSPLALEIQGEVDRFVFARGCGDDPLAHFENVAWEDWLGGDTRSRYEKAHRVAARYCRGLERRFPQRSDVPALLCELRAFYRASPQDKLHASRP
jgi:hypothetical protein